MIYLTAGDSPGRNVYLWRIIMRIFDTQVQELKYKVLMELAWQTWKGNDAFMVFNEIANEIVKKGEPPMSCCIYKDRAIVAERIRLALGGDKKNPNVIQVIGIACCLLYTSCYYG